MEIKWIVNNCKPEPIFEEQFFKYVLIKLKDGTIPKFFYYYEPEANYDPELDKWLGMWIGNGTDFQEWYYDNDVIAWAEVPDKL